MGETDEDINTAEIEEEDRVGYMKRSTRQAEEKMRAANIPCWIDAHEKMKWRLAMRITSHPETRTKKHQNGIQASALDAKQAEQCEDRERDGKTTLIN